MLLTILKKDCFHGLDDWLKNGRQIGIIVYMEWDWIVKKCIGNCYLFDIYDWLQNCNRRITRRKSIYIQRKTVLGGLLLFLERPNWHIGKKNVTLRTFWLTSGHVNFCLTWGHVDTLGLQSEQTTWPRAHCTIVYTIILSTKRAIKYGKFIVLNATCFLLV